MKKAKTSAKLFCSDPLKLEKIILSTMKRISSVVGCSLGPGGKVVVIESDLPGIPNKNTKDGVSIFRSLGANDPYEHLIIEQTRDVAIRTVNEAGDGPQDLNSKILTPSGWIRMGDVKVGMKICGTNGTVQEVLGVFPKGIKEKYEVHFSGNGVVVCCEDHLWSITTSLGTKKILPLKSMIDDYKKINNDNTYSHKYFVQTTEVEFHENKQDMPISPYLLGVLLGDGSLSGKNRSTIEIAIGKNKEHILEKLVLPEGIEMRSAWVEKKNYFRVKLTGKTKEGLSMRGVIESVGLLGVTSKTKYIPKAYLFSSIESRKQLFQGMIDTDGHVNQRGVFEFSSVSKQLSNDFADLCRSLGKQISFREKDRSSGNGYSKTNTFCISERVGYKYGNKITNIIKTGKFTEMQCIKVSNPDSLYITDNFVVTHNTTTATVIAASLIENLFNFCKKNRKYSPQKATRLMNKILNEDIIPSLKKQTVKINSKNMALLEKVATISSNGDKEMARAVIKAFEEVGFGASSHVTIQEISGEGGYNVSKIEGYPVNMGYEQSIGRFANAFINNQANQRCDLEKPLFILFDGKVNDMILIHETLQRIGEAYVSGNSECKNIVVLAHEFGDSVLTTLAFNFNNPQTINVIPLTTPLSPIFNAQAEFLKDISAFTGAKIFDMNTPIVDAQDADFGTNVEKIQISKFTTTIVGNPEPLNIESRINDLQIQKKDSNKIQKQILDERIGKLSSGIAQLQIIGSSMGEIKERTDRAEDAVCAVRAAINHGCLPGGCRFLLNAVYELCTKYEKNEIVDEVLTPSLIAPFTTLLNNAGYNGEEIDSVYIKLMEDKSLVYDVENQIYGDAEKLGLFDAALAVEQALRNAFSIASVMGTLGGIVAYPRDGAFEREQAGADIDYMQSVNDPMSFKNEANERF